MLRKMYDQCKELPISNYYHAIKYQTIGKSSKWWSFIVLFKANDKIKIGLYLFQKKEVGWKRKHKFTISSKEEYQDVTKILDMYSQFL